MSEKSMAARVAAGEVDPPENVQEAIAQVKDVLRVRGLLQEGELARGECSQEQFDFEMLPAQHYASQYQEVDGEVVEIVKRGADGEVQIIHRPEMSAQRDARAFAPGKV